MDSLTQIVLGAGVGEFVAGKKLGNRAMIWGAIAGTIPDLDVLTNLFVKDDIWSLAAHRGITHSFFFTVLFPFLMAKLLVHYYDRGRNEIKDTKKRVIGYTSVLGILALILIVTMIFGDSNVIRMIELLFLFIVGFLLFNTYRNAQLRRTMDYEKPSYYGWYWLFFWGILTHWMLDTCTTYGTQILQPFSNMRFTTSAISVVDPMYTLPLLFCLLFASTYSRHNPWRRRINTLGLIISSLYLIGCHVNKYHVQQKFAERLEAQGIHPKRIMTSPGFMNNYVWNGIAELDSTYIVSDYSLNDKIIPFERQEYKHKGRELIAEYGCENSRAAKVLDWFSNGYYVNEMEYGHLIHSDLRFGNPDFYKAFNKEDENKAGRIFYFKYYPDCRAEDTRGAPMVPDEMFKSIWQRIEGY